MSDDVFAYDEFPVLRIDRPSDGVLRITLEGPGLNAVGPDSHAQLADVWRAFDRDPAARVAVLQGAGKGLLRRREPRAGRLRDRRQGRPAAHDARGA